MRVNATAGGGVIDLMQKEVNAPEVRQVRVARGRNTLLLYGCNNCPEGCPLRMYLVTRKMIYLRA